MANADSKRLRDALAKLTKNRINKEEEQEQEDEPQLLQVDRNYGWMLEFGVEVGEVEWLEERSNVTRPYESLEIQGHAIDRLNKIYIGMYSRLFAEPDYPEGIIRMAKAVHAAEERQLSGSQKTKGLLSSKLHQQGDFFVADILDAAPKDDLASMEHPLFALKTGDMRVRKYERNGNSIEIKPGFDGCATIHDKDVWIYCISQLVEAINRGREDTNRTVRFTAYDFLVSTNRPTAGVGYDRMADALRRLSGTRIETNIATVGQRERAGFGLIDSWRVIERSLEDDRMVAVEVTLPDWLWRSVKAKQVLTLSRDYFRIRKPLDRRIYELVRKHCGDQAKWRVSIQVLHEKSGSAASIREFRRSIKTLAMANDLPDYRVEFDQEADTVTFYARGPKGAKAKLIELFGDHTKPKRDS